MNGLKKTYYMDFILCFEIYVFLLLNVNKIFTGKQWTLMTNEF